MSRIKWLLVIAGIELVGVVSLLLWVVFAPPKGEDAKSPVQVTRTLSAPKVAPVLVAKGLGVPTAITSAPGKTTLYVAERHGLVHTLDDNKLNSTLFMDISGKVMDNGEMGLLGLTFHPKFATNGYFYVNYIDKDQNTIIARYQADATTGVAIPTSEKILIKLKQPYTNHNGGQIAFGPDGYLYIGLGDGGSSGDPENRAQDKNVLFGKLLRVDVDHGDPYAIPTDNPFAKTAGARPEIWALGLRNPWRFSFDSKNGDLYIADVGQNLYEELDLQAAGSKGGANYGWRCYEATHAFNATGCLDANQYVAPVLEYDHSEDRCSVTGGNVYRGQDYPALLGKYFFADNCGGQVYMTTKTSGKWTMTAAATTNLMPTTFGTDNQGELYFGELKEGGLYRLTDTANTPTAK